MNYHINIGLLRQARMEKGMSLKDVAEAVGCSRSQVSRWENGRTGIKIEMLLKLCWIYRISLDGIFIDELNEQEEH